ncbi:hypothetical protein [Enterovibrio coralii]|uniref:Uncharacterized protein n=1 Tax=Enterovibrio coralii TaxID=294935 RepID=A0A135IA55_9GAMM|nr:hypothetical protein [Enterovibrio coralii]KXF82346.1 hypothetical protein ATN88_09325 [Enterovibrio coralii]
MKFESSTPKRNYLAKMPAKYRLVLGLFIMVQLFVLSPPVQSSALNDANVRQFGHSDYYGELSPTQVYALILSVDALVTYYAEQTHPERVTYLPTKLFEVQGYRPEDVFVALGRLSDLVDLLAAKHGVTKTQRIQRENEIAIPAEVFLQAAECLDTLALILRQTNENGSYGDFYAVSHGITLTPKTPSDVFSLVDLIERRLRLLSHEERNLDE